MPKHLEQALKREAAKRGFTGKRRRRYIYGKMRDEGWRPSREKKADKEQSDGTVGH